VEEVLVGEKAWERSVWLGLFLLRHTIARLSKIKRFTSLWRAALFLCS